MTSQEEGRIRQITREAFAEVSALSPKEVMSLAIATYVHRAAVRIGREMSHLRADEIAAAMSAACDEMEAEVAGQAGRLQ